MADFVMPKLGADMTAGLLVAWHVKPGDSVHRGDIVAEVETDKGLIEVEIFHDGVIDALLVEPGAHLPVGTPLARIREGREAMPAGKVATVPTPVLLPAPTSPAIAADTSRLRISPSARELARQLQVDPATVQGTGRGGAITREDIERAAASKAVVPAPAPPLPQKEGKVVKEERGKRMRQVIAAAMSRSKREIPHYYLSTTIDLQPALDWLARENLQRPVTDRLLPGVLFLKAVALALRSVPELNSLWVGEQAVRSDAIHVGAAISLREGGLVAPAIHNTDQLSLGELMKKFQDLVSRARAGTLRSSELSDPTITVTSLGEQGVDSVFGIIYPPQVAIVGFGRIVERPWIVDGNVVRCAIVNATLSADHRVTDGHRGARFLAAVERLLQEPAKL